MIFKLLVTEVFQIENRTVFVGKVDPPDLGLLPSGRYVLIIDDKVSQEFDCEGEWLIESRPPNRLRALSSSGNIMVPEGWRTRRIEVKQQHD